MGELAPLRGADAPLSDPRAAEVALEQVASLADARRLLEGYQAVARTEELRQAYAQMSGLEAWQVRRNAQEAALWAGRRIGELLGVTPKPHDEAVPKLPKIARERCRALAAVPLESWRRQLERWRTEGAEPTAAGMRALAPRRRRVAPSLTEQRAVERRIGRLLRAAAEGAPPGVKSWAARAAWSDDEQLHVEAVEVYLRVDPAYRRHVRKLAEVATGKLAELFKRWPSLLEEDKW